MGYIVSEYCSGGDLAQYLKSQCVGERMPEEAAKNIMVQVTKGKLNNIFIYTLYGNFCL